MDRKGVRFPRCTVWVLNANPRRVHWICSKKFNMQIGIRFLQVRWSHLSSKLICWSRVGVPVVAVDFDSLHESNQLFRYRFRKTNHRKTNFTTISGTTRIVFDSVGTLNDVTTVIKVTGDIRTVREVWETSGVVVQKLGWIRRNSAEKWKMLELKNNGDRF